MLCQGSCFTLISTFMDIPCAVHALPAHTAPETRTIVSMDPANCGHIDSKVGQSLTGGSFQISSPFGAAHWHADAVRLSLKQVYSCSPGRQCPVRFLVMKAVHEKKFGCPTCYCGTPSVLALQVAENAGRSNVVLHQCSGCSMPGMSLGAACVRARRTRSTS